MEKTFIFHTLGCKLNFAETSSIGKSLIERGFRRANEADKNPPSLCIINTCSVTDTADHKCRQVIKKYRKMYPETIIIVIGCYAQLQPQEIANQLDVDLIIGANEKFNIDAYLSQKRKDKATILHTETKQIENFKPIVSNDDRTRYFLKVQDGCDYYCSYCTIPFARGKSRSATIEETIQIAKIAAQDGAKEIVLTGVNTGDFGRHTGESFIDLLRSLEKIQEIERYRISSIEPNLLTDEIIQFVANSKKFMPHFHIPLQSGSNDVLKIMKRRYNRELFKQKINTIKQLIPHAFIGVDVIVGTRGETDQFFNDSKIFIENLDISQLHVFTYSERANTKALDISPIIPQKEREFRNEILRKISDKKLTEFYDAQYGRKTTVLWEETKKDIMHGFTDNYVRVCATTDPQKFNTIEQIELGNIIETEPQLALGIKNR